MRFLIDFSHSGNLARYIELISLLPQLMLPKFRQPPPRSRPSTASKMSKKSETAGPANAFLPIQSQPVSRHHAHEPYLREIPQTTLTGPVINGYFPYMPSGEYPGEPVHFTKAYSHGCQLFAGAAMTQCLAAYGV